MSRTTGSRSAGGSLLGLRRSEVLAPTWESVDSEAGTLTVAKSKTRSGVRTVPLAGTDVAEALRKHKATLSRERLQAGAAYHGSEWLAVDEIGRPVDKDTYSRLFHKLADEAGHRHIRLRDCRHTAGTLLRDAGVHPAVIARWLGHSKGSFSITTYADDPVTGALTAAGEALGRARSGASDPHVTAHSKGRHP